MYRADWTAERVKARLVALFAARPGMVVVALSQDRFDVLHPGPISDIGVLDAASVLFGSRSVEFQQLLQWARCTAAAGSVSELCRTWGWSRSSFDEHIEMAARKIASYLNKRQAVATAATTSS
jgi:hypothetical protein